LVAAGQLSDQVSAPLLDAAHRAFVHGLQLNALIGVVGFTGLAILVGTMLRNVRPHAEPEAQPAPEHTVRSVVSQRLPEAQIGD
jgi:hypothetical protein